MAFTNTQLRYYDYNVLRLSRDSRTVYTAQVNGLIERLTKKIHEHTEFKVSRVVKAGSFAKHTILRKAVGRSIDVDVAFYLSDRDVTQEDYESLGEAIYNFLVSLYPTKSTEDFTIGRKVATVTFIGTGLNVDIVPVIEIADSDGYGYQFGADGSKVKTSVPGQLAFLRKRKDLDSDFRTLIRLAKQWRHYHDVPGLKGYGIELLMAHLLDRDGLGRTLEERFRDFLRYLAQSGLIEDAIYFPENSFPLGTFTDPVVIIDPVNSQNNVGARITEAERQRIVKIAQESYETAIYASTEEDIHLWKEVFGPRFKVED